MRHHDEYAEYFRLADGFPAGIGVTVGNNGFHRVQIQYVEFSNDIEVFNDRRHIVAIPFEVGNDEHPIFVVTAPIT